MKDNQSIDLFKFIFALCVVTIHCYVVDLMEPTWIQDIVNPIILEAVPFFFTVSAYFIIRKFSLTPHISCC